MVSIVNPRVICIIFAWSDDLLLGAKQDSTLDRLQEELEKRFKMERLGFPHKLLSMGIKLLGDGSIAIDMYDYTVFVLAKFDALHLTPLMQPSPARMLPMAQQAISCPSTRQGTPVWWAV